MLILGIIVTVCIRAFNAGGFENLLIPAKKLENELAAEMATYPGNDVLFEQLEAKFPDSYDRFTETLANAARAPGPEDRVVVAGNAWIMRFFAAHEEDFSAAPLDQLDRVMELEKAFYEDLRGHDEFACASYAKGEPLDTVLPERFDIAGGEIVAARLEAIQGGRLDQQLRFALTPTDYEALEATLRGNGLNDEQVAVVFGTADPASIGAPLACEMQIELITAIQAQPDERRALLIGAYAGGS